MIVVDVNGLEELQRALGDAAKKLPKEVSIAVNRTSKWTTTQMSRQVREELAAKASAVKKVIRQSRKAKASSLTAEVELDHQERLPLKAFNPRQTRAGVTAKVTKRGGRTKIAGGFMGPRPGAVALKLGGHAFKRVGKARTPIVKLMGLSPWGVYTVNRMKPKTIKGAGLELQKQIRRRVEFQVLKRNRLI